MLLTLLTAKFSVKTKVNGYVWKNLLLRTYLFSEVEDSIRNAVGSADAP